MQAIRRVAVSAGNRCKSPGDQAFAAVTSWASEERSVFELSYDLPVLGDAGFLSTNLGVNQTGTGNILQKLVIPF
ncbi:MAG: hypothetical protein R3C70_05340 [Geminicoccaceae bacterium]